jgi:hypothetical protein
MRLHTQSVYIGAKAPNESTKTTEDATQLRLEVSMARGNALSSPVFKGPLPYEVAVGSGCIQRDIEKMRAELLLCTAQKSGMVMLSSVSHYESYMSLLEHDILHVAADLERRATVVKSLQRSCRDRRRAAELERKHEGLVRRAVVRGGGRVAPCGLTGGCMRM